MGTKLFSKRNRVLWMATGAAILILASASNAIARTETLAWSHPNPAQIARFEVHYGAASNNYTSTLPVGKPTPDASGVFSYNLQVPDDLTIYVTVSAIDQAGVESLYSNERVYAGLIPTPTPAPAPTVPTPEPTPPPIETAFWSEDFSSLTTGSSVSGWLDTGAGNSMVANDNLFSVIDLGGNHALSTLSTATNIHSHIAVAGSSNWSNYEYSGMMKKDSPGGGIGITAYSEYPQRDAYYRIRSFKTGESFRLDPHPDGQFKMTCSSSTTGVYPEANIWYRFKLRVQTESTGTVIQAKVWQDGNAEPSSWQVDCVHDEAIRLTSGTAGVWSMGSGGKYWDELRITPLTTGIGGSSTPLTPPGRPTIIIQ